MYEIIEEAYDRIPLIEVQVRDIIWDKDDDGLFIVANIDTHHSSDIDKWSFMGTWIYSSTDALAIVDRPLHELEEENFDVEDYDMGYIATYRRKKINWRNTLCH